MMDLWINPAGSDSNSGASAAQPLKTGQLAADAMPFGEQCHIFCSASIFSQKISVNYYKLVNIWGDPAGGTIFDDKDANGVAQPGVIFHYQDHAMGGVQDINMAAYHTATVGVATRNFAIADVNGMTWTFQFAAGVSANERSRIIIHNPHLQGDVTIFANSGDGSLISVEGTITSAGVTISDAFLKSVGNGSTIQFNGSMASGSTFSGVRRKVSAGAEIQGGGNLPGSDVNQGGIII